LRRPRPGGNLPGHGTPFASSSGARCRPASPEPVDRPTLVRRTIRNRLRLLGVALAGVVLGALVGYLLLTVTILRWSAGP